MATEGWANRCGGKTFFETERFQAMRRLAARGWGGKYAEVETIQAVVAGIGESMKTLAEPALELTFV
jgi:hypothetical protein